MGLFVFTEKKNFLTLRQVSSHHINIIVWFGVFLFFRSKSANENCIKYRTCCCCFMCKNLVNADKKYALFCLIMLIMKKAGREKTIVDYTKQIVNLLRQ